MLDPAHQVYVGVWASAVVTAVVVAATHRRRIRSLSRPYARFLLQPWKLVMFAIAATGLAGIAPHSGDPTWDYVDASLMSVLTFSFAPWAVGVFARRDGAWSETFVAAIASLFAFSWSYDGYILLRDGVYPSAWASNLAISGVIYAAAGMFWSLRDDPDRGIIFGFMHPQWPDLTPASPRRLVGWMLVFVIPVALAFLYFVWVEYA